MIIMAQHPQQQKPQQQQIATRATTNKQLEMAAGSFQTNNLISENSNKDGANSFRNNQIDNQHLEHDGKRSLIKNQLYLIEQLQLENASLRNERDQLQLENEELKFQLQIISSSNILRQPNATFDNKQLDRLVDNESKQADRFETDSDKPNSDSVHPSSSDHVAAATTSIQTGVNFQEPFPVSPSDGQSRLLTEMNYCKRVPCESTILDHSEQRNNLSTQLVDPMTIVSVDHIDGRHKTGIVDREAPMLNTEPQDRDLPHDEEEERVKLVEQRYGGDSELIQASAVIIQRAFRKYQICKRFRTITEKLRHTHQAAAEQRKQRCLQHDGQSRQAASWESLSQAANRLAAVAKQQQQLQQEQHVHKSRQPIEVPPTKGEELVECNPPERSRPDIGDEKAPNPVVAAVINFQQLESMRKRQYRVGLNVFNKNPDKGISFLIAHSFIDSSCPVSKAGTGYYHSNQLHFMDSKQHTLQQSITSSLTAGDKSVDMNAKGQFCKFCLEEEYLKQNVARFLLHRKGLSKEKIGQYLGNLQSDFNQDVLKYYLSEMDFHGLQVDIALRKFLSSFRLPGEAQKIERIVDLFAKRYVICQQIQPNVIAPTIIEGNGVLNKSRSTADVSSQLVQSKQEQKSRELNGNASNYKNNLTLLSKDEIFILTFAIIMLNTDLHSPSLKPTSRMSASQFINNLRGVFKSQTIVESDLVEIYERVKANQISTTPDHVSHVMKVQQGLTVTNFQKKELPNLCVPHRRLVCFCRLFEVYDVNKKEKVGQHQREIFLFNDLLLVTKLARRVRANANQLYTYRQSISLQGLYVQLFQTTHYNFGIRLCQRSNDEIIIMFNARNELDRSRFVDDLSESIAEMDEMETIRHHNIIDAIHAKNLERLRRHALLHNMNTENQHVKNNQKTNTCDSTINNNRHLAVSKTPEVNNIHDRSARLRNQCLYQHKLISGSKLDVPQRNLEGLQQRHTKFSSMMNLSGSSTNEPKAALYDSAVDTKKQITFHNLRPNQSLVLQNAQRSTDKRIASQTNDENDFQQQQPIVHHQRRSSTSSVHSLDSGLFLSRDVSPNQSN